MLKNCVIRESMWLVSDTQIRMYFVAVDMLCDILDDEAKAYAEK